MLNLLPIFQDAVDVFPRYASHLTVSSLPATVYLMQRDVINHYRHAATHYLPLSLHEGFLQNSSIGSPYEKWAKFTNEDFREFAFTVTNLMRYTTRLIHETESVALRAERRHREASARSNGYIAPLAEIDHRGRQVGIRVFPDERLTITPFATESDHAGRIGACSTSFREMEYWHITVDAQGGETKRIIDLPEYERLTQVLRETEVPLHDRSVLQLMRRDALAECGALLTANEHFRTACNSHYAGREVAEPFDNTHQSWWL